VPFGWDLYKIENMCLRIDLGDLRQSPYRSLDDFNFRGLADMQRLTSLTVIISVWEQWTVLDPKMLFLDTYVGDDGIPYQGSPELRRMLKRLRDAVPECVRTLEFGLGSVEHGRKPEDWGCLRSGCCVPGDVLRSLYAEVF
jgi:hypothetical protein